MVGAMRVVVCTEYGPPESLVVEDRASPVAGPGQVVVDVAAAAVNFPDVLMIANKYQVSIPTPFVPGNEFSGVVSAVGVGASWSVGDRVFGASMIGGFAEQIVVHGAALRRVPDGVDLAAMAGFWIAHMTSYCALRSIAGVKHGDRVVVLGAGGGVGLAAVELAAVLGCDVLAAASSDDKLAICRQRGAAHTVNYDTGDLRAAMKEMAPDGVDVVIDPVGGRYSELALRSTTWGGRFVTLGYAAGEIPRIPLNLVLLKGVVIKGYELRTFAKFSPDEAARDERELMDLVASGRVLPHVSARYGLDDVAAALHDVADRRAVGKVLIVP
jgi:NADPH:quinone reductase